MIELVVLAALIATGRSGQAQPSVVTVVRSDGGYHLTRNGQKYFIKGAGGDASQRLLHDSGGNSVRTWGGDLSPILDQAQKNGLTVAGGIWLGQKSQGFDYHDARQVAVQYEAARKAVLQYRDAPALLVWGLGNEMEVGQEDDPAVWRAIEAIAAMTKKLDPNHPTMTVIAEVGGDKVSQINRYCPDIDIIGINSYAGGASVGKRYQEAGGVKPYILTEFGPPGTWELPKNSWGAVPEPTSTQKADWYRKTYQGSIAGQPLCLGSYAFTWGHKQEATATWFGMLLPDGRRVAAVDVMSELWTGKAPPVLCPVIQSLTLQGSDQVAAGSTVEAVLDASDPQQDPLKVAWVLQADPSSYHTGGASEGIPPAFPEAILHSDAKHASLHLPVTGGAYRLFAYVHDNHDGAAVANVPLFVTGGVSPATAVGAKATLPLVVYDGTARTDPPYTPSGYMGNTGAIKMDDRCLDYPHTGKTCFKVDYTAPDNWGGVVWQNPADDWGDRPGGSNLTGAKVLTFWARGAEGGEVVTFQFGLLGKDKAFPDTGSGKLDKVSLTKEWKQYKIDLAGKDLTRIKTGFSWVVAGQGHPLTFYLSDIRYE